MTPKKKKKLSRHKKGVWTKWHPYLYFYGVCLWTCACVSFHFILNTKALHSSWKHVLVKPISQKEMTIPTLPGTRLSSKAKETCFVLICVTLSYFFGSDSIYSPDQFQGLHNHDISHVSILRSPSLSQLYSLFFPSMTYPAAAGFHTFWKKGEFICTHFSQILTWVCDYPPQTKAIKWLFSTTMSLRKPSVLLADCYLSTAQSNPLHDVVFLQRCPSWSCLIFPLVLISGGCKSPLF